MRYLKWAGLSEPFNIKAPISMIYIAEISDYVLSKVNREFAVFNYSLRNLTGIDEGSTHKAW